MTTVNINVPITAVEVLDTATAVSADTPHIQELNERVKREKVLHGSTYQLKTPLSEYTWYITINNIILNEGTEHEKIQPFEIFFNTKDVTSYQWMIFASRLLSAVFRKGGDIKFILDEMAAVYQPNGGYLKQGGYVPSLVAEIGRIIEIHFKSIGLLAQDEPLPAMLDLQHKAANDTQILDDKNANNVEVCPKCGARAYTRVEGCATCTVCYYSKCG